MQQLEGAGSQKRERDFEGLDDLPLNSVHVCRARDSSASWLLFLNTVNIESTFAQPEINVLPCTFIHSHDQREIAEAKTKL